MTCIDGPAPRSTHRIAGRPVGRIAQPILALAAVLLMLGADAPSQPAPPASTTPGTPPAAAIPTAPAPGTSGRDLSQLLRYSATGAALPDVPINADLSIAAKRTTSWKTGGDHQILLEGDVRVTIGSYGFTAERAVILLTPHPIPGVECRNVAVYFENVTALGGYGLVNQEAPWLLVTAVLIGKVELETDLHRTEPADNDPLVQQARARVQRYQLAVAQNTINLPGNPVLVAPQEFATRDAVHDQLTRKPAPPPLPEIMPTQPGTESTQTQVPPGTITPVPPGTKPTPTTPIRSEIANTDVDFHADKILFQKGDHENYIVLIGNVQLMYIDRAGGRRLNLSADKAVIFADSAAAEAATGAGQHSLESAKIRGVYLEDNVITTDGQYTLRGPRLFYDLATHKAIVLDAVFYTWDVTQQLPLYMRAEQIRQYSRTSWGGSGVRLSTSDFGEPHFSIGARNLTITADKQPDGTTMHNYTAKGVGFNIGEQPVFYWPAMSGDASESALKSIEMGSRSRRGAFVESHWDLFALTDTKKIPGIDATLLVDGYSERGAGVGVDADYDVDKAFGEFKSYYLHDDGTDRPGGRLDVDPDNNERGRILWRHRHELGDGWEASLEIGWISDPTFLEEWFPREAYAEKEYETSFYLKQQQEDWAFTFLGKYDLLDFVAQDTLLQSRGNIIGPGDPSIGYTTDKYPELAYYRIGTPILGDRLTWYSENRATAMRLNLPRDTPANRGFTAAQSTALFGMAGANANLTSFDSALRSRGFDEDTRYRGDTRQEIDAPLKIGDINITPYTVGRVTAYDTGFGDYSGDDQNLRLWGSIGLRADTAIHRTYETVENRLLDLHRLRHVIEPSLNVYLAATTLTQSDLPIYDYDIESLNQGTVGRFGVRNTLQTQRGGEGHWRNVDWIRLDTDFIVASHNSDIESPLVHFFDYRPELSLAGESFWTQLAVQLSDTMALVADADYSFETDRLERWDIGLTIDHTPRLTTFVWYRNIETIKSEIVRYGVEYVLTPKYHVSISQSFDIGAGKSRDITLVVTRRLPDWLLLITANFDTIEDTTSFGVGLVPHGIGGGLSKPTNNPFLANPYSSPVLANPRGIR